MARLDQQLNISITIFSSYQLFSMHLSHIVTGFPSRSAHHSQESLQLETAVCYVLRAEHQDGCGSPGCLGGGDMADIVDADQKR